MDTIVRDRAIHAQIRKMLSEKSRRGVHMYKESYIYDVVADEYGLAARTVANIWKYKDVGPNISP